MDTRTTTHAGPPHLPEIPPMSCVELPGTSQWQDVMERQERRHGAAARSGQRLAVAFTMGGVMTRWSCSRDMSTWWIFSPASSGGRQSHTMNWLTRQPTALQNPVNFTRYTSRSVRYAAT